MTADSASAAGRRPVCTSALAAGAGRRWRTVVSPDPALTRRGTFITFSAQYRDGVRLRLPDRMSKPFQDASAEFTVPVRAR